LPPRPARRKTPRSSRAPRGSGPDESRNPPVFKRSWPPHLGPPCGGLSEFQNPLRHPGDNRKRKAGRTRRRRNESVRLPPVPNEISRRNRTNRSLPRRTREGSQHGNGG